MTDSVRHQPNLSNPIASTVPVSVCHDLRKNGERDVLGEQVFPISISPRPYRERGVETAQDEELS